MLAAHHLGELAAPSRSLARGLRGTLKQRARPPSAKPWKRSAVVMTSTMYGSSSTTRTRWTSGLSLVMVEGSRQSLSGCWEHAEGSETPLRRRPALLSERRERCTLSLSSPRRHAVMALASYARPPHLS